MKDNLTGQTCDICNSHIISYRENGKLIFECSYCGTIPDDIIKIELDDIDA